MTLNKSLNTVMKNVFEYDFNTCVKGIPHYLDYQKLIASKIYSYALKKNSKVSILDLGCGTANVLQFLDGLEIEYSYVGVDNNVNLLNVASSSYQMQNCEFVQSDALDYLENSNELYDITINSWSFHNWTKTYRNKVLEKPYSQMSENGLFVNADKIAVNDSIEHAFNYDWQLNVVKEVFFNRKDIIQEWTEHYLSDENPLIKITEKDYLSQLKVSGFKSIKIERRDYMDTIIFCNK